MKKKVHQQPALAFIITGPGSVAAPSQQHQLRRGRDAQNERDGAGLRSSVAAATPSPLRRSSAPRTMIAGSCRPPPAGAPGHQISYHVHHHHIKCVTHSHTRVPAILEMKELGVTHPEKKIVFLLNELVG